MLVFSIYQRAPSVNNAKNKTKPLLCIFWSQRPSSPPTSPLWKGQHPSLIRGCFCSHHHPAPEADLEDACVKCFATNNPKLMYMAGKQKFQHLYCIYRLASVSWCCCGLWYKEKKEFLLFLGSFGRRHYVPFLFIAGWKQKLFPTRRHFQAGQSCCSSTSRHPVGGSSTLTL